MSYSPGGGSSFSATAPTFVATNGASSTNVVPMPAGLADNDIVLAVISKDTAGGNGGHLNIHMSDTWYSAGSNGGEGTALQVFAKKVLAGQGSLTVDGTDASQDVVGSWAFRDGGLIVPLAHGRASSGTVSLPAFRVPIANMMVILIVACGSAGGSMTSVPAGYTNRGSVVRWFPTIACATKVYTAPEDVGAGLAVTVASYSKNVTGLLAFGITPALV